MRIPLGGAFVALVMSFALAASASATPNWQVNGANLTKATAFFGGGALKFERSSGSFGHLLCGKVEQKGMVGPGAVGEITSLGEGAQKAFSCSGGTYCSHSTVEAVNLPWHTELATVNGKLSIVIKASESKAPEWALQCPEYKLIDEFCPAATSAKEIENSYESGVGVFFDEDASTGNCSEAGQLKLTGTVGMKVSGGTLGAK